LGKITYKTVQGDTWDIISSKVYGTDSKSHIILDENLALSHIVFFDAGTEIIIPEISSSSQVETSENLPPWRL